MATPTYTPLAELTLGSSAASVTFSSISQAYRDLVLVVDLGSATATCYPSVVINSDTGSNYPRVVMYGDGSSATSSSATLTNINMLLAISAGQKANAILNFMDYSATDKHKSALIRSGSTENYTSAIAARWSNTSAITTIAVNSSSSNFAAGSTFALFGIAS